MRTSIAVLSSLFLASCGGHVSPTAAESVSSDASAPADAPMLATDDSAANDSASDPTLVDAGGSIDSLLDAPTAETPLDSSCSLATPALMCGAGNPAGSSIAEAIKTCSPSTENFTCGRIAITFDAIGCARAADIVLTLPPSPDDVPVVACADAWLATHRLPCAASTTVWPSMPCPTR